METKGHIISDKQLAEYEELKTKRHERHLLIITTEVARYGHDGMHATLIPKTKYEINFKHNIDEKIQVFVDEITDMVESANTIHEFSTLQSKWDSKVKEVEKITKEINQLTNKREELLKVPTIWQFIENRRNNKK